MKNEEPQKWPCRFCYISGKWVVESESGQCLAIDKNKRTAVLEALKFAARHKIAAKVVEAI